MAKFYWINDLPDVKINPIPTGIRRFGLLGFRPLALMFPYQSQKPIKFILNIEYRKRVSSDYREFQIRRIRQNPNGHFPGIVVKVHEEDNRENKFSKTVLDTEEHDDGILEYEIFFPRTGKGRRLVYSKPLDSNFVPVLVLGVIVSLPLTRLFTWLWGFLVQPFFENIVNILKQG